MVSQVGFFFLPIHPIQSIPLALTSIQLQYLHQFRPWASAKSRYTLGTDACPVPHLRAPHPHPAFRLPTQPPEQQQFIHGTGQNLEAEKKPAEHRCCCTAPLVQPTTQAEAVPKSPRRGQLDLESVKAQKHRSREAPTSSFRVVERRAGMRAKQRLG